MKKTTFEQPKKINIFTKVSQPVHRELSTLAAIQGITRSKMYENALCVYSRLCNGKPIVFTDEGRMLQDGFEVSFLEGKKIEG